MRAATLVRSGTILLIGGLVLWIAMGVTLDLTIGRDNPALTRRWWPGSINAKVAEAQALLSPNAVRTAPMLAETRAILRTAVLREPVNSAAVGTLAILEDYSGETERARTLFRLSEALSRRNNMTQLWLIEDAVARGDVSEAITHYDRALRVSYNVHSTLLSVLVDASSDLEIRRALAPVLARQPLWWPAYVQMIGEKGENADAIADALRLTRIDPNAPDKRPLAETALRRMIALGAGKAAVQSVNRMEGHPGSVRTLQDGDFEDLRAVPPFGWTLRDETSLRAYRDAVPTGTQGLRIEANSGASGWVAQQALGLLPGRHVLKGIVGSISDDTGRPLIELRCGRGDMAPIARYALPLAREEGQSFSMAFDLPATGCDSQWLYIVTAPAVDSNFWLDGLAIVP
jgi:hypothetical protein